VCLTVGHIYVWHAVFYSNSTGLSKTNFLSLFQAIRATLATGGYKPRDRNPQWRNFFEIWFPPLPRGDFHIVGGFPIAVWQHVVQRSARSLQHAAAVATSEPHWTAWYYRRSTAAASHSLVCRTLVRLRKLKTMSYKIKKKQIFLNNIRKSPHINANHNIFMNIMHEKSQDQNYLT